MPGSLKPTAENIDFVMNFLRQQITEARTDVLIDKVTDTIKLPKWVPGFILKRVLDSMLPEKMLDAIEHTLRRFQVTSVDGPETGMRTFP